MKILFNGYKNLYDKTAKQGAAGGPRLFVLQLIQYLKRRNSTFVGLVINSKKHMKDRVVAKRFPTQSGEWLELTMRLNLNLILNSKSLKIDRYTQKPIELLTEVLKKEKPDVVLLIGFSIVNWYMLMAAHKAGIPVAASHHGLWFKEAPYIMAKANHRTLKLVKKMENDINRLASWQIFLNKFSKTIFEKEYKIKNSHKASIVPIPYNPVFANLKLPKHRKNGRKKIGFVGRWDLIKNPQIIMELAKEIKRQDKPWDLVAVIKINEAKLLKPLVKPFQDAVTIIPPMLPKELKKFYQSTDLLLLPSQFDVSPTVVFEAALQNRGTVISPAVGLVDEYKKYGMNKWIHDFKNPKNTIKYLEKMFGSYPTKKFITNVRHNHASTKILGQYFQILELIREKHPYEDRTTRK